MPRGDRTGPAGWGPMSGRGAGYCAGFGVPGYMNPMPGMGRGMGQGMGRGGRGYRHMYWATGLPGWQRGYPYAPPAPFYEPGPEQELAGLREQVKFMEEGLRQTQERIQELEQEQSGQKKK